VAKRAKPAARRSRVVAEKGRPSKVSRLLWLSERVRRQGFGSELIAEAERRARRRGSKLLHLSTYSFQAPRFYEKHGFRCCGKMSGSPKGASRYYYMKRL